ncbi:monovalent cation/H+ antiporter complex subunit F [Halobacillus sp. ACCC02827]|uniref:monovalent cation/H+ antiporter complex subunit F n=1 Tax=Bacillaceae TaxID=186817 RepID=UPI0002A50994|nr:MULTISPECIES: monovalent cation/H+ antiporter complex subunit F [Bacillaceae]ELK45613.1 monovalent cation/H+ antiporter subunit F [Halobacillus sp. BAB-2008]WJE16886.1 monovalent cation/H+ antiporter complex subunit F [Halobacillus sp. ACCC02827]
MTDILIFTVDLCIITVAISILILVIRAMKGPSEADKSVALDAIGINMMAMTGLLAIKLSTTWLSDVLLLIGILLFVGTVATAKIIEKRNIIEK